ANRSERAGAGQKPREFPEEDGGAENFDLREYKEVSLVRRIRARMTQVRAESVSAYSRLLDENAGEHVALINTILINVTGFFRDSEAWKVLAEHVVPRLVEDAADSRSLRIWSTGCSSREEAYCNALIYFTGELQDRILTRFHYSIREDGFLFLGRSESLLARSRLFTPVHQKWRIFRRTSTASRPAAAGLSETGSAPHALAEAAAPS